MKEIYLEEKKTQKELFFSQLEFLKDHVKDKKIKSTFKFERQKESDKHKYIQYIENKKKNDQSFNKVTLNTRKSDLNSENFGHKAIFGKSNLKLSEETKLCFLMPKLFNEYEHTDLMQIYNQLNSEKEPATSGADQIKKVAILKLVSKSPSIALEKLKSKAIRLRENELLENEEMELLRLKNIRNRLKYQRLKAIQEKEQSRKLQSSNAAKIVENETMKQKQHGENAQKKNFTKRKESINVHDLLKKVKNQTKLHENYHVTKRKGNQIIQNKLKFLERIYKIETNSESKSTILLPQSLVEKSKKGKDENNSVESSFEGDFEEKITEALARKKKLVKKNYNEQYEQELLDFIKTRENWCVFDKKKNIYTIKNNSRNYLSLQENRSAFLADHKKKGKGKRRGRRSNVLVQRQSNQGYHSSVKTAAKTTTTNAYKSRRTQSQSNVQYHIPNLHTSQEKKEIQILSSVLNRFNFNKQRGINFYKRQVFINSHTNKQLKKLQLEIQKQALSMHKRGKYENIGQFFSKKIDIFGSKGSSTLLRIDSSQYQKVENYEDYEFVKMLSSLSKNRGKKKKYGSIGQKSLVSGFNTARRRQLSQISLQNDGNGNIGERKQKMKVSSSNIGVKSGVNNGGKTYDRKGSMPDLRNVKSIVRGNKSSVPQNIVQH